MIYSVEVVEWHKARREHFTKGFNNLRDATIYFKAMVLVKADKVVLWNGFKKLRVHYKKKSW